MLVLSRKPGESIVIDGRITVKIVRLEGDIVKLGIEAPHEVSVHRQEVYDEIQKNNREALGPRALKLPRLSLKNSSVAPAIRKPTLAASAVSKSPAQPQ
jgi:carbon storage regulator